MPEYRTSPAPSAEMPRGIPYIVGNEAAERFSYYGMRTILVVFMTRYLMGKDGELAPMDEEDAKSYYHLFLSAAYFFPLLGAILSDVFLGKYRTIIGLSIVYCLGHLALAVDQTRLGLAVGLGAIAIGSGGIKPCVSAHVGDQFGAMNKGLLTKVYAWFYFSINLGAFISSLLTPWLLEDLGPHVAFGVPGALMLIATWVFWLGRRKFVHIPPGGRVFLTETLSSAGLVVMRRLGAIYIFVAVFWSLYDQTGSAWVLQAERMDLKWLGIEWLPAQIQAVNPILVLILIPLFTYVVYPALNSVYPLSSTRKMAIGFFVMIPSFLITAWIESRISAGDKPSIGWQFLAYVFLTGAEVMVYQTGLEFSYTQAPRRMKSFIMSFFLLTVSLGNAFTALVNSLIQRPDGTSRLEGVWYHLFFAGLMGVAAALFLFVIRGYRERAFLQGEDETN